MAVEPKTSLHDSITLKYYHPLSRVPRECLPTSSAAILVNRSMCSRHSTPSADHDVSGDAWPVRFNVAYGVGKAGVDRLVKDMAVGEGRRVPPSRRGDGQRRRVLVLTLVPRKCPLARVACFGRNGLAREALASASCFGRGCGLVWIHPLQRDLSRPSTRGFRGTRRGPVILGGIDSIAVA